MECRHYFGYEFHMSTGSQLGLGDMDKIKCQDISTKYLNIDIAIILMV